MIRIEQNYANIYENNQSRRIKDVMPELKNIHIKMDSVDFSREGRAALREQMQGSLQQIDVDEIIRMRGILPKMSFELSYDMKAAMHKDIQNSLDALKQSKGDYSLDDLIASKMDAYARQYESIQRGYADGTREVYKSDGIDENGRWQYHKVTLEEDLEILNKAFGEIADEMVFAAKSHEVLQRIKETFNGQKPLAVPLPNGYEIRLADTLKRAVSTYAEQREKGNSANAAKLARNYLNEDKSFANVMRMLFSVR